MLHMFLLGFFFFGFFFWFLSQCVSEPVIACQVSGRVPGHRVPAPAAVGVQFRDMHHPICHAGGGSGGRHAKDFQDVHCYPHPPTLPLLHCRSSLFG